MHIDLPAGSHAINPATGEAIPIWVADYVLGSYGSGAIMAVPAHDTRDFEFAQSFGLPVRQVVQCSAEEEELPTPGWICAHALLRGLWLGKTSLPADISL